MLGGVSMTNNISHYDSKSLTLMIKCIVDQVRTLPTEIYMQFVKEYILKLTTIVKL